MIKDANCIEGLVGDEDDVYLVAEFFTHSLRFSIYESLISKNSKTLEYILYEQSV